MAEKIKAQPLQIDQPIDIKVTSGTINQAEIDRMADIMANKINQAFKRAQSKTQSSGFKAGPSGALYSRALHPMGKGFDEAQWNALIAQKRALAAGLNVPPGSLPFMGSNVASAFSNPLVGQGRSKFPDLIKRTPTRHINVADQEFIRNWIETPLQANLDKFSTSNVAEQSTALMKRMTSIGRKKTISRKDFAGAFKMYHNLRSDYIKGSMPGEGATDDERSNFEKQLRNLGNIKRLISARSRVVKEGQSFKDLEEAPVKITEAVLKSAAEEVKKVEKAVKSKKGRKSTKTTGFGQLDFGFGYGSANIPPIVPPKQTAAGGFFPDDSNWKQLEFNFKKKSMASAVSPALGKVPPQMALALAGTSLAAKMGEAVGGVFDKISEKVKGVFSVLGPAAGKIFGDGTLRMVGPMFSSGFKSILTGAFSGNLLSIASGIGKVIGAAFTFVIGSVANVATKITKTIIGSIVSGFKTGFANLGEVTRGISLAAIPLASRGQASAGGSYSQILNTITSFVGTAHVGSVELASMAQKFIRINGSASGMVSYMKAMLYYSHATGEAVNSIDDTFLEMSSFFGVNLEKSGANLVRHMTKVFHTSNVTASELKTIAEWIMPAFANSAGTAEEKMAGVVSLAGKLAQLGLKHPRQLVQYAQTFEQLTNPNEKMFQLLSILGKEGNLFTAPDAGVRSEWDAFYADHADQLKELQEEREAASLEGDSKLLGSLDAEISKISDAFSTGYQDFVSRGLTSIRTLDLSEKIGKSLTTNPKFRSQMSQTLGGSNVAAVIEAFKKSQESIGNVTEKSVKNVNTLIESIGKVRAVAKSAWTDTFTYLSALIVGPSEGEFLNTLNGIMGNLTRGIAPALEALGPGMESSIANASPLGKALFGLGQIFKSAVTEGFAPAIVAIPDYIQAILNNDTTGATKIGEALAQFMASGFSILMKPLKPLITGVVNVISTLFMSVFNGLINSGFASSMAEAFIQGFKQMIVSISGNTQLVSLIKAFAGVITSSFKTAFLESASSMPLIGFAVGASAGNIAKSRGETAAYQRTIEDASGTTVQKALKAMSPTVETAGEAITDYADSIKKFSIKLRQESKSLEAETINL